MEKTCKKCGGDVAGVEYSWDSPEHYDGVSEWECLNGNCGQREGRWSGKVLERDEVERRYGYSEEEKEILAFYLQS